MVPTPSDEVRQQQQKYLDRECVEALVDGLRLDTIFMNSDTAEDMGIALDVDGCGTYLGWKVWVDEDLADDHLELGDTGEDAGGV